jgi:hypothetical protein
MAQYAMLQACIEISSPLLVINDAMGEMLIEGVIFIPQRSQLPCQGASTVRSSGDVAAVTHCHCRRRIDALCPKRGKRRAQGAMGEVLRRTIGR